MWGEDPERAQDCERLVCDAVKVKPDLEQRPQDAGEAGGMRHVQRRAAGRKQNQPRSGASVAGCEAGEAGPSKALKLKYPTSDIEPRGLMFPLPGSGPVWVPLCL